MNFASINAKHSQVANPGGAIAVAVALCSNFTGDFPVAADVVAGEIAGNPSDRLPVDYDWALYELPKNTLRWESTSEGDDGFESYRHMVAFETAGFKKEIVAELTKHINAPSVFLVKMPDGQWGVVGSSQKGINLKQNSQSGTSGTDKRGTTLEGEENGYMYPVMPLAPAVADTLSFLAVA